MYHQLLQRIALAAILAIGTSSLAHAKDIVTFAWTPNPQTPQVDLALQNGYFDQQNLDVKLVSFPSGREGFEALTGGQVDFSFMTEFPAAVGVTRDQNFAIIADLSRYRGSRVIANSKSLSLTKVSDLEGKRIGTTLGTNVAFYLDKLLKTSGTQSVIVNASPVDLVPALVRGDVDAAVTFPTFYSPAQKALGEQYQELRSDSYTPHFIISASTKVLQERPDVATRFMKALLKADNDLKQGHSNAQKAVINNMQGMIDEATLQTMWQDTDFGISLDSTLVDLLVEEGQWIIDRGIVNGNAPSSTEFATYVNELPLEHAKN